MSAKLLKNSARRDAAAPLDYAPFRFPASDTVARHFLSPDQSRGTASVRVGDDNQHAARFRPRDASSPSASAAAPRAAREATRAAAAAASPEEAEAEASNLVREAQTAAERILSDAAARAGLIEREARERGYAEGEQAAFAQLSEEVEPLRRRLAQTLDELVHLRASLADEAERDLVRLALEIAKRIVHREVTMDREIVLTLARVALGRLHDRARALVHLHPEDYAYVAQRGDDAFGAGVTVELIEDRSVARGGCLVSTEMGDIDARLEHQFAEVERGLLGV